MVTFYFSLFSARPHRGPAGGASTLAGFRKNVANKRVALCSEEEGLSAIASPRDEMRTTRDEGKWGMGKPSRKGLLDFQ
jgi:hypothetical protein